MSSSLPINTTPIGDNELYNVFVLCTSFFLLFAGFLTAQNLVTSFLPDRVGYYSLLIIYVAATLPKPIAPKIASMLGHRRTMIVGASGYCLFLASLIYVVPALLYISSALLGFGGAILWVAQAAFLTEISRAATRGRNAGMFLAAWNCSGVFGNLVAFVLLTYTDVKVEWLMIVLTIFGSLGTASFVFLRKPQWNTQTDTEALLPTDTENELEPKSIFERGKQVSTQKNFWLLIPLNLFIGYVISYSFGSFPTLVTGNLIGLVMACRSAACFVGSFGFGWLIDRMSDKAILCIGAISYTLSFIMTAYVSSSIVVPYVVAVLLGFGNAAVGVVAFAAVGRTFEPEMLTIVFSALQMLQSIFSSAGFFVGAEWPLKTSPVQIIISASLLVPAVLFYMFLDPKKPREIN